MYLSNLKIADLDGVDWRKPDQSTLTQNFDEQWLSQQPTVSEFWKWFQFFEYTPGPWLLRISVVRFSLMRIFKKWPRNPACQVDLSIFYFLVRMPHNLDHIWKCEYLWKNTYLRRPSFLILWKYSMVTFLLFCLLYFIARDVDHWLTSNLSWGSVLWFSLVHISKSSQYIRLMPFSLHNWMNSFTHAFLVTNDFSAADLVHADFCQT